MTQRKPWLVGSCALAAVVFLTMLLGWTMQWNWVASFDATVLGAFYRFAVGRPGWVTFWNVLCTALGPVTFRVAGAVLIVLMLVRRQRRVALFLVVSVELAGLVTVAVKAATDRPRPATAMVAAAGSSFPSGHALEVTVGVLAIALVVLPMIRPAGRPWLIAARTVVVVAVGVGRVVLNVHHPSDVVAGWALGYLYFSVCLLILAKGRVREGDETLVVHGSSP